MRAGLVPSVVLVAAIAGRAAAAAELPPGVALELEVDAAEAKVGDPLPLRLTLDLRAGLTFEPRALGPALGPFSVVEESWGAPTAAGSGTRFTWQGRIAAYRTGELELPAIGLDLRAADGTTVAARTEPRTIVIGSVLDPAEEDPALADLKPPASVPADYGPLLTAASILGLLLLAALVAFWLHRRYGARLAAVPQPDDPFQRTPPDVWIYAELQKLLARRLAEQGQVDLFFAELSRLIKTYLGGRYRVELLDRTTAEVPEPLRQSGVTEPWIAAIEELLLRCDLVKFARRRPDVSECREAIEQSYRIVDATKPAVREASAGAA